MRKTKNGDRGSGRPLKYPRSPWGACGSGACETGDRGYGATAGMEATAGGATAGWGNRGRGRLRVPEVLRDGGDCSRGGDRGYKKDGPS
jgi:hypothetical protein